MKRIVKGESPTGFEAWKAKANDDWQPNYGNLQNPEKETLHDALLSEQGWVCCYCGRSVSTSDSHIEHFRPQKLREDLALDFTNLHASCIREVAPGAPLHCGHVKGDEFDESRAISPQDDCERRFIFSVNNGAIYPADSSDEPASYMISLLQLDIDFLRNRRAEVLQRVFDEEFVTSASDTELEKLAAFFRQADAERRLTNFGHVLARYAEQLLGLA